MCVVLVGELGLWNILVMTAQVNFLIATSAGVMGKVHIKMLGAITQNLNQAAVKVLEEFTKKTMAIKGKYQWAMITKLF